MLQSINRPEKSEAAFSEFYDRYKSYLLKVCRYCCKGFDSSDQLAEDVFQNAFLKVFHKAYTFNIKDASQKANISAEIKAWLARIAKNELINFLRKNPDEKVLSNPFRKKSEDLIDWVDTNDGLKEEGQDGRITQPSIQKSLLEEALKALTEKERIIILTYMEFFDPSDPLRHLPEDIIKGLCLKYSLKPASIRQIKKRSLEKLRTIIENISNAK